LLYKRRPVAWSSQAPSTASRRFEGHPRSLIGQFRSPSITPNGKSASIPPCSPLGRASLASSPVAYPRRRPATLFKRRPSQLSPVSSPFGSQARRVDLTATPEWTRPRRSLPSCCEFLLHCTLRILCFLLLCTGTPSPFIDRFASRSFLRTCSFASRCGHNRTFAIAPLCSLITRTALLEFLGKYHFAYLGWLGARLERDSLADWKCRGPALIPTRQRQTTLRKSLTCEIPVGFGKGRWFLADARGTAS